MSQAASPAATASQSTVLKADSSPRAEHVKSAEAVQGAGTPDAGANLAGKGVSRYRLSCCFCAQKVRICGALGECTTCFTDPCFHV